jgi:hypothetical protein
MHAYFQELGHTTDILMHTPMQLVCSVPIRYPLQASITWQAMAQRIIACHAVDIEYIVEKWGNGMGSMHALDDEWMHGLPWSMGV